MISSKSKTVENKYQEIRYGLYGSTYYAGQMTDADVANTIAMINLETIIGGDIMYVYSGLNDSGWARDQALSIAQSEGIPLETNPGNDEYPYGTTGLWSDHVCFEDRGIPIAYFETTNWETDGYVQTAKHGEILHTENDTLAFLEREYPGRVERQLEGFMDIVFSSFPHSLIFW